MKSLGDKIRYFRNQKNWSQEQMADKLKLSLPAYSKIERDITDVSFSRLKELAKVFGITVIQLLSQFESGVNVQDLEKKLAEKNEEINKLQKKIIDLLEKKK